MAAKANFTGRLNFREKKLLFSFFCLILLILAIGLIGISQVQGLTRRVQGLGKHNLGLAAAVLEMRASNTIYAMGIRSYVFWKESRYLGAVPMAINLNGIIAAGESFKKQLAVYRNNAYLAQQQQWADQIGVSFDEILALGAKIVELADKARAEEGDTLNNLFMAFESRVYKLDEFLDEPMGKSNLKEVERQMSLAEADKRQALFSLRLSLASALAVGMLIAVSVYRRRIREHNYRQQLFNRMINVEENERKNLSAAVHDEMGQGLSAMKIYLGLIAQGLGPAQEELKGKVEECRKIISGLIEKSHNIAFLLRPPDLDEVGLLESLEELLIESKHLTGVEYIFRKPPEKLALPQEYNLLIYRLVQEFLTNMAKYAQAKNIELCLNRQGDFIELSYRDDGRGFDYNQAAQKFLRRKEDKFQLGLLGLKQRVEVLDGQIGIDASSGKGTSISVRLPV